MFLQSMYRGDYRPYPRRLCVLLLLLCAASWAFAAPPKYIFLMIGDGMGLSHRNAAELYQAAIEGKAEPGIVRLSMSHMPVHGMMTTHAENSNVTDSAAAGTALATGYKTRGGVVSMDSKGTQNYRTLAEVARERGMMVGIISDVSLDHATPACFYSHNISRGNYYSIALDLVNSDYEYFAGGGFMHPKGKDGQQDSLWDLARTKGFRVVRDRRSLNALTPGEKVLAVNHALDGAGALYYEIDRPEDHISLAEFTAKGVELLDNPDGFFMMVEGGKIDWASHANDTATVVHQVLAFDKAVAVAVEHYKRYPDETLIVVTADHETGGMSLGYAGNSSHCNLGRLALQKGSGAAFLAELARFKEVAPTNPRLDDFFPVISDYFGLVMLQEPLVRDLVQVQAKQGDSQALMVMDMMLTDLEIEDLEAAFRRSMQSDEERADDARARVLYGGYEPLVVAIQRIVAHKVGVDWTTFSHTPIAVPLMARGVGQEQFSGYLDNTEVAGAIMRLMGASPEAVPVNQTVSQPAAVQAY